MAVPCKKIIGRKKNKVKCDNYQNYALHAAYSRREIPPYYIAEARRSTQPRTARRMEGIGKLDIQKAIYFTGGDFMAIIQENTSGSCRIIVHDDYIVQNQEEIQKIVDNVSRIVINEEKRRAATSKEKPA